MKGMYVSGKKKISTHTMHAHYKVTNPYCVIAGRKLHDELVFSQSLWKYIYEISIFNETSNLLSRLQL